MDCSKSRIATKSGGSELLRHYATFVLVLKQNYAGPGCVEALTAGAVRDACLCSYVVVLSASPDRKSNLTSSGTLLRVHRMSLYSCIAQHPIATVDLLEQRVGTH